MNANRDRLDDAIDRIAARMTTVEEDAALAARIAVALPERPAWSVYWLLPRLAVAAALAIGTTLVVLRPFNDGATGVGPAKAGHHNANVTPAQAAHHKVSLDPVDAAPTSVSVVSAFRRTGSGTMVDRPDHEFSLPAIEAVPALAVDALTPSELALPPVLVPAPLMIADLPLSSDFPPH